MVEDLERWLMMMVASSDRDDLRERLMVREKMKAKGVFGLAISITHILVSITHNSKIVGPITKRLFEKS